MSKKHQKVGNAQQAKTADSNIASKPSRLSRFWNDFMNGCCRLAKGVLPLATSFYLIELLAYRLLEPTSQWPLIFGALWALLLASIILLLPRLPGRIVYGIVYYAMVGWTLGQTGYFRYFRRMMWLSDMFFLGEGSDYLGDVISGFPALWWIGGIVLLLLGACIIWKFPKSLKGFTVRIPCVMAAAAMLSVLIPLPEVVFQRDLEVWGTRSEYAQSSSWRATYNTMYDARNVYDICGLYQLTYRDVWKHEIYPLTPGYQLELRKNSTEVDEYFEKRGEVTTNEMTGILEGKNVVLVLMESMDDYAITPQDTPTLYRLMNEGINFTNFYTPGYGGARTINSEFCFNSGIYLPTTGAYVFNYVTNHFNQSIASQLVANGYSAEAFHYNTPDFYSRGVFEPALGYNTYNTYADYTDDKNALYSDTLLFDIPELNDLFFREGQTFNFIITRSAHLSYVYNEVLSHYALKQYPQYKGMYGSEEEDCIRVKARLVDDMFTRMLAELEANGTLENTVIIGVTDHYTYGYKNMDELLALSGVEHELLLEKTPCFIWTPGGPQMEVDKTLNSADLLPTVLNLLGIDSPYRYLGQDAFDPGYEGYALFPDGSWISDGVACLSLGNGEYEILMNEKGKSITEKTLADMAEKSRAFIRVSNLLLISDYYQSVR